MAASACASLHSPWRATKLETDSLCLRDGIASAAVGPARGLALAFVGSPPVARPIVGRTDAVDRRRPGDLGGRLRIEYPQGPAAIVGLVDRGPQEAPIGGDSLVGLAEMLVGAVLDGAHRLAGPLVVHLDVGPHAGEGRVLLLVRIEAVVVGLVLARHIVGQLVELEPLAADLVLVD